VETIAIIGVGDMGSAVGAAFARQGYRIVTDLSGRSAHSRKLAEDAGFEDLASLERVAAEADLILSILPPAAATNFAQRVSDAMATTGNAPVFVDCNAVAPSTVRSIAALFEAPNESFLDVGIVGPAPRPDRKLPTRFYVAGAQRGRLLGLKVPEIKMLDMGEELGRASSLKMGYAAMNKATDALYTAVLMAADKLGVRHELIAEFEASQPDAALRMRSRIPYLAATSERFAGEMREIATTFRQVGVTAHFHEGAEWVFEQLAATELAKETRATLPEHRSLDAALAVFVPADSE